MTFDVLGDINYLAALVAALAYFAIGAVWYSPMLFANSWLRATGREGQQPQPNILLFVGTAVAYFIQAIVLAAIARSTDATEAMDGVVLGLFVGVGVVATMLWVNIAYEQRPAALFWINGLNAVIGFVVMAVIVTVWT